jgi:hypothetical protein
VELVLWWWWYLNIDSQPTHVNSLIHTYPHLHHLLLYERHHSTPNLFLNVCCITITALISAVSQNSCRNYTWALSLILPKTMCLYMVVHYGPNPFSPARIFSRQTVDTEWRVERFSLNRLRELWHLKCRSQDDLNKAEKYDDFDMSY